jgi:hypothetical protein
MKKFKAHHVLTPKGGRVAARKFERPEKRIIERPKAAPVALGVTPTWMRRTRSKGSAHGLGA